TTRTSARPATWPRCSRTSTWTPGWPRTTWARAPRRCWPRRWSWPRSGSSCTPRTRSACPSCITWARRCSGPPCPRSCARVWRRICSPNGPRRGWPGCSAPTTPSVPTSSAIRCNSAGAEGAGPPPHRLGADLAKGVAQEGWRGLAGVEPADPGVTAEPGFLAAGEPPGGLDRLQPGFVQGPLPVQVAEQLLVAQGPAGGPALAQALGGQAPHLGFQARLPHPADAGGDPLVEFGPRQGEADLDGRAVLGEGWHGRGERAPRYLDHLQGAHDPAPVAGQDRGRRGRVEAGQPGVQSGRADVGELLLEAGPDSLVCSGKVQVIEGGADVEAGTAGQDGHPAAGDDLVDRGPGELGVFGHVRGLGHRPDVEQVMRDAAPGGRGFLGRADVHALVELHRVGVHHLAAEGEGELGGQP